MTSRRARNRPDKRELARIVHSVDSHDLDMDLAAAWVEPDTAAEDEEPEDRLLVLKDGSTIDKREPWSVILGSYSAKA